MCVCVCATHPGDGVVVLLDAVVRLFQAGRLKRGFAHQQRVPGTHTHTQWFLRRQSRRITQDAAKRSQMLVSLYVCVCADSQYASQGPDVHLVAVALLAEHLGCDVVGRPAQGLLPLAIKLNLRGQTKVP